MKLGFVTEKKITKLNFLKEKKEVVSTVLLGISVISVILILAKATSFFVASARAQSTVKRAIEQSESDEKLVAAHVDKFKKDADALKKDNLFSPPPPKRNPITAVLGIFGDEALINGKWYKAGDKVADAMILAINPTSVETEWDGKKKTFRPIDAKASASSGSRPGRPTSGSSKPGGSAGGSPQMVVTQGPRPAPGGRGMPGMGGMTPERLRNMSEDERNKFRAQMRERFERMSEAERDKFRQEMRERMGGGRGPGGGRGGRR
ncbi:MAG: hypothetical protein ACYSWW_01230 [Planctomycetota bacterium]|jgi:hypothetical protein